MPVFKAVNERYLKKRDLENLISYVVCKNNRENPCGAQAVLLGDAQSMFRQMMEIKTYFHKERNRQALHYVLSFSREEEQYIGEGEALQIGYAVAACFPRWQVIFGIHKDTDNLHIHFVVNGTSFADGKAFDMSLMQLQEIQSYVNVLTEYYHMESLPEETRRERIWQKLERMAAG